MGALRLGLGLKKTTRGFLSKTAGGFFSYFLVDFFLILGAAFTRQHNG
jgi:hypothetical protein